ncbi:MAG: hypothetical protein WD056_02380 [Gemmatimonadota bacterium]
MSAQRFFPIALPARGRFRPLAVACLLGGILALPSASAGQSLLAGAGLGIPADPLDARTRAVGGVGVGMAGWSLSATDPAAIAGLVLPTITATMQPTRATLTDGRTAGHAWFPTIGVSYPLWRSVFSITLASALDQRWEVITPRLLDVNGTEVGAIDAYQSSGNVGRVQLGWATRLRESLAVGITVGSHVGVLERRFSRSLDPGSIGEGVENFATQGRWRASGLLGSAGVAWDPTDFLRLGAAVSWTDELRLTPSAATGGEAAAYSIPMEFRVGGSGTLAPGLLVMASLSYADWTTVGEELREGATRGAAWSYGGGVEWGRAAVMGRALPIRLGARRQELPFLREGVEASETVLSAGAGFNLVEGEGETRARIDLGIERGTRSAGDLSERFLRTSVTLRLSGG